MGTVLILLGDVLAISGLKSKSNRRSFDFAPRCGASLRMTAR